MRDGFRGKILTHCGAHMLECFITPSIKCSCTVTRYSEHESNTWPQTSQATNRLQAKGSSISWGQSKIGNTATSKKFPLKSNGRCFRVKYGTVCEQSQSMSLTQQWDSTIVSFLLGLFFLVRLWARDLLSFNYHSLNSVLKTARLLRLPPT